MTNAEYSEWALFVTDFRPDEVELDEEEQRIWHLATNFFPPEEPLLELKMTALSLMYSVSNGSPSPALRLEAAEKAAEFCRTAILTKKEQEISNFGQTLNKIINGTRPRFPSRSLLHNIVGRFLVAYHYKHKRYPTTTKELKRLLLGTHVYDREIRHILAYFKIAEQVRDKSGRKPEI